MSFVEIETASQPECWRRAADLAPSRSAALPATGERIAVVGCGTSLFVSRIYAALREGAGHGETDSFPASEYRGIGNVQAKLPLCREPDDGAIETQPRP